MTIKTCPAKPLLASVLILLIVFITNVNPAAASFISSYNILKNDSANQPFIQRIIAGGASEAQIESFLNDLESEVSKAGQLNEANFDSIMFRGLKEVITWKNNRTVFDALSVSFSEEIAYTLNQHKLHPNLMPLRNAVRESVLGQSNPSNPVPGGGGGAAPAEISKLANEIKRQLDTPGSNAIILLLNQDSSDINIPADLLQQIISSGRDLHIKNGYITLRIKAENLRTGMNGISFGVRILSESATETVLKNRTPGQKLVGQVYELTSTTDGGITPVQFQQPITVLLSYAEANLSDINDSELDVYYFNESTRQWERMHGVLDRPTRTISYTSSHFSKYTIMTVGDKKSVEKQEPVITPTLAISKFTDLTGHWASEDIQKMVQLGLVSGVNNSEFAPDRNITRAEFTALLVNAMGIKPGALSHDYYSDVTINQWYFGVVNSAAEAGLVSGISASRFGPERCITREQMAVMISNALTFKGKGYPLDMVTVNTSLAGFTDQASISPWAREGVARVVRLAIAHGRGDGLFAPADNATRAEAAIMILKMYQLP